MEGEVGGYLRRKGTTHVERDPLDLMAHILVCTLRATFSRPNQQSCRFVIAKLEALVPSPRAHLTPGSTACLPPTRLCVRS